MSLFQWGDMALSLLRGLGWLALGWQTHAVLGVSAASVVLTALLLAELVSVAAAHLIENAAPPFSVLILGGVVVAFVLTALTGQLALFRGQGAVVVWLIGLAAVLIWMRHSLPGQPTICGLLHAARLLLWAAGVAGAARLGPLTAEAALLIILALSLLLGLGLGLGRNAERGTLPNRWPGLAQADLLVLPYMPADEVTFCYLLARGATVPVRAALAHLAERASQPLEQAGRSGPNPQFSAAAARLNLGVLLVGGGTAIAVLAIAPVIPEIFGVAPDAVRPLLHYLLLGAAAPVFFGAADALLHALRRTDFARALSLCAALVLWLSIALSGATDALSLALGLAAVSLGANAFGAGYLMLRAQVWPGLTALLLHRIRLK